jgi:hypothetical protein
MARPAGIILIVAISGLLVMSAPKGRLEPQPEARTIPLARVIRFPIKILRGPDIEGTKTTDSAILTVSPGAVEEQPEGPSSFDVLEDGSIVLSDPLRSRLAVFDALGKFRQSWKIGFAADSVTSLANGLILVREASSGQVHVFDKDGRSRLTERLSLPERPEAHLINGNSGTVMRPTAEGAAGGTLAIQFEKAGSTLISIEFLATGSTGDTYVALESTTGGKEADAINLNKYVRKYAADGSLISEIKDIPLDYYIPPVDELRVHKGMVYQLYTTESEVRINLWNMN